MTLEQYNFLIDLAEHGSKFNGYKTHKSYIPIIKRIYKSLNNLVSGDPEKDLEAANIFLDNL
ncbi:MAG: hypothetical protein LBF97_02835 [Elusimicrobiota bacterium]|nr:hypothetical protein [Elusimicrobiota bacterium]